MFRYRYLNKRCIEKEVKTIAFFCPKKISASKISSSLENQQFAEDYMKDVMKASENDKFVILAPYFEKYDIILYYTCLYDDSVYIYLKKSNSVFLTCSDHWILLVICPNLSRVYVFDSKRKPRKLTIREALMT